MELQKIIHGLCYVIENILYIRCVLHITITFVIVIMKFGKIGIGGGNIFYYFVILTRVTLKRQKVSRILSNCYSVRIRVHSINLAKVLRVPTTIRNISCLLMGLSIIFKIYYTEILLHYFFT